MTTATRRSAVILALSLAYACTILAANLATAQYGLVHLGPVAVTAGTFAVGLSFVARDALHDTAGRWPVVVAIAAGAGLSGALSPAQLAIASGVTFLVSETADLVVYTPLRRRTRLGAWVASNVVASPIDSILFLWLAGFPLSGFAGQTAVKIAVGVLTPVVLLGVTRAVLRYRLNPASA